MPTYSLTAEAKTLAIEIDRRIKAKQMARDLHYLVDQGKFLYPHNQTAEDNKDLSINYGGIMSYVALSDLVDTGFVRESFVGGSVYSFRILQALHDAVDANFAYTNSTSINVGTMHVSAAKVNFHDLANDHDKLADMLIDKLIPFLEKQEKVTRLELQGLREAIEVLRQATDAGEIDEAANRIWTYVERASAVVGLLTAAALGLPK